MYYLEAEPQENQNLAAAQEKAFNEVLFAEESAMKRIRVLSRGDRAGPRSLGRRTDRTARAPTLPGHLRSQLVARPETATARRMWGPCSS